MEVCKEGHGNSLGERTLGQAQDWGMGYQVGVPGDQQFEV